MIIKLRISVELPHPSKNGQFINLYRNQIDVDSSLDFDYQMVVKTLRLLYPQKGAIINFSLIN